MDYKAFSQRVLAKLTRSPEPQPPPFVIGSVEADADTVAIVMSGLTQMAKMGYAPNDVLEAMLEVLEEMKSEGQRPG